MLCYFKNQAYCPHVFDSKGKFSKQIQNFLSETTDFLYVILTEMGKIVGVCWKYDCEKSEKEYMFMVISVTTQGLDIELISNETAKETTEKLKEIFENEFVKDSKEKKEKCKH